MRYKFTFYLLTYLRTEMVSGKDDKQDLHILVFQVRSVGAVLGLAILRISAGRIEALPFASVIRICATVKWWPHNHRRSNATSVTTVLQSTYHLLGNVLEKFASLQWDFQMVRLRLMV